MNSNETSPKRAPAQPERDDHRYEPPRVLSKRSIERVTLVSTGQGGPIGPGSPIGGE